MKWQTVATAPDQVTAEMWAEFLRSEGIPARVHPGDFTGFMGVSMLAARVQTPEEWVDSAVKRLESLDEPSEDESQDAQTDA